MEEFQDTPVEDFKYLVEEFADLKIMRYRIPEWNRLSLRQKEYLYCLGEAAKYGRDILFDQNFKYNIIIRKTLETVLKTYRGDRECVDFKNFTVYAKRVFFSNGIHHHYAEDKFFPGISQQYFNELLLNSDVSKLVENKPVTIEAFCKFITFVIFEKSLFMKRRNSEAGSDMVATSSVNFYENVTQREVEDFYAGMQKKDDKTPVSYGLNSKVIKENGKITEQVYKLGGLYGEAIEKIICWLEKANRVAENESQRRYTNLLIEYYRTGDLKTWDEYNIAWVEDTDSSIDFINGFIEDYNDPLGRKATWESVVNFRDEEATLRTAIISGNAQWFEDNSPVDPRFKKKEVKGVSAKAINVTTLGGDCFPTPPIGINLPNADWIRRDYGSKSVTITNLMDAYDKAAQESPRSALREFAFSEDEITLCRKYGHLTDTVHTNLHECLGHGSGQLLSDTQPGALKEYSSALEEARADLFGLYYIADPKLVELGILPDNEAYKAEYCGFIRNGLMTQLARIELGKKVTEAHMQDRKLIASWCYEKGRSGNVIERKRSGGKTFFVINDFVKLRSLFGELLAEVQRIKSEGDYEAGRNLIENYASNINPDLHKEVRERYAALNLKPYGGFINPEILPAFENGKLVDYEILYPDDFLQQHLQYGDFYATLQF